MKEIIKLIDKDFFPEFKEPLTEASGINGAPTELPSGEDLTKLREGDDQWNVLFKKYINSENLKYYVITVSGFQRNNPIAGEPTQGFIKYVGKTEQSATKNLKTLFRTKWVDTLQSSDIEITENEENATLFELKDTETVVNAIKRNKDFKLKGTQFSRKVASDDILNKFNYGDLVINSYLKLITKDENAPDKFRQGLTELKNICRKRTNCLVGNPLLDMLGIIVQKNPRFNPSSRTILTLNNLVADRVVTEKDILNPSRITGSLCYNNNLYRLSESQIESLFNIYEKVKNMKGTITIPQLEPYQSENRLVLAKNVIFKTSEDKEADVLVQILNGKGKEGETLPSIGYKPEGNILTGYPRDPKEADAIYKRIFESNEVKEEGGISPYYLYVGNKYYESTNLEMEESIISGRFEDVFLKEGERLYIKRGSKIVDFESLIEKNPRTFDKDIFDIQDKKTSIDIKQNYSASIDFSVDSTTSVLKSFTLTDVTQENDEAKPTEGEQEIETTTSTESVPEGYEEIDPDGTTVGDEQQDVTVQVGDKVVGLDGNRLDVTAENIGGGKWNIKAGTKIWRLKPEPADTTTSTTTSTGESFVGGKTLDDILKMTKDEFKTFSLGLTPEDKAKLKAFGGKLLAAK